MLFTPRRPRPRTVSRCDWRVPAMLRTSFTVSDLGSAFQIAGGLILFLVALGGAAAAQADDPGRAMYGQLGARYRDHMPPMSGPPSDPRILALVSRERITVRLKVDRIVENGLG